MQQAVIRRQENSSFAQRQMQHCVWLQQQWHSSKTQLHCSTLLLLSPGQLVVEVRRVQCALLTDHTYRTRRIVCTPRYVLQCN